MTISFVQTRPEQLALTAVSVTLTVLLCSASTISQAPGSELTPKQWHADLSFFADNLAARHANAFHFISRETFEDEVSDLDRQIDSLDNDQIFVRMDQIANTIGDGHTYIRIPPYAPAFPVRFESFGEDYRLAAAAETPAARLAVGGKLLRVGDVPVERVRQLLLTLTPADETEALRAVRSAALLRQGMVLHGLGILSSRDTVRYTVLTDDGRMEVLQVSASPNTDAAESGWLEAFETPPLWLQRPTDGFWCKYLDEARTGYCAFRSYKDLKATSRALRDLIAQHPENLVIDLRLNSGGDFTLGLKYVVRPIRGAKSLNRKGHLFVLIGPKTFSAAMSNAAHFRDRTNALLVGEPIGEKPNSYQEARDMILPNSHWDVRYSVKFYRFAPSGENLIRPDRQISETWDEYREGKDPVLDWVLHYVSSRK